MDGGDDAERHDGGPEERLGHGVMLVETEKRCTLEFGQNKSYKIDQHVGAGMAGRVRANGSLGMSDKRN